MTIAEVTQVQIWRRVFHLGAGSVFPLAALWTPQVWVLAAAAAATVGFLGVEAVRPLYAPLNRRMVGLLRPLMKPGEERRVLGPTYLLLATTLSFLLFEAWATVPALLFLSLGDPVSALVGKRVRIGRLGRKSLPGAVALFVVAALVGLALGGWSEAPRFSVLLWGAVAAALMEVLPVPLDDNLTIPLASGTVMMALA